MGTSTGRCSISIPRPRLSVPGLEIRGNPHSIRMASVVWRDTGRGCLAGRARQPLGARWWQFLVAAGLLYAHGAFGTGVHNLMLMSTNCVPRAGAAAGATSAYATADLRTVSLRAPLKLWSGPRCCGGIQGCALSAPRVDCLGSPNLRRASQGALGFTAHEPQQLGTVAGGLRHWATGARLCCTDVYNKCGEPPMVPGCSLRKIAAQHVMVRGVCCIGCCAGQPATEDMERFLLLCMSTRHVALACSNSLYVQVRLRWGPLSHMLLMWCVYLVSPLVVRCQEQESNC